MPLSIWNKIKEHTFLRNFSLLAVGNFGARFIAMVTNIIVARYLAPERYGEYSLVLTYISIFYVVASLGLNQLVIRSVARDQGNSEYYFKLSLILRMLGFVVSAVAFALYCVISQKSFETFIIFAILGGVLLDTLWEGEQNVAFGMQKMEWNTIIGLVSSILNLVCYVLLPRAWFTVYSVLSIYLLFYFLRTVAYYVCLKRFNLLRLESKDLTFSVEECKGYLIESFPFYIMFLLGLLTSQFPILFLERHSGIEEVAFFNTANKLLLPITLFMNTAFSAFFPNQSILFAQDKNAFSLQTRKVLALVCGIGIYMAMAASLFKSEIVLVLYGESYACTANVLAYQCWYLVLYCVFCLNGNTLGAADSQKKLAICSVVYAIISTPILLYASRFGAEGLAKGFVVASIINLIYIMPVLKKTVNGAFTWSFSFALLLVLFCSMGIGLFAIDNLSLAWRAVVFVALTAFVIIERKRLVALVK
jgi:O-antigen/teichoic acid export membrane protein